MVPDKQIYKTGSYNTYIRHGVNEITIHESEQYNPNTKSLNRRKTTEIHTPTAVWE